MTEYKEPKVPEEMDRDELVARVHCLQAGLMPFAMYGIAMADARMRLVAAGRNDEPAGGHWINNLRSTAMTPSEAMFYQAMEIRGRAATEEHMLRQMEKMSELTKASVEKGASVDRTDN